MHQTKHHERDERVTAAAPDPTPGAAAVLEAAGARYVRLMRQAVHHPDDYFHQEAVEQIDRLCRPWATLEGADLRSVLTGIHDELLILLHHLASHPRADHP